MSVYSTSSSYSRSLHIVVLSSVKSQRVGGETETKNKQDRGREREGAVGGGRKLRVFLFCPNSIHVGVRRAAPHSCTMDEGLRCNFRVQHTQHLFFLPFPPHPLSSKLRGHDFAGTGSVTWVWGSLLELSCTRQPTLPPFSSNNTNVRFTLIENYIKKRKLKFWHLTLNIYRH